MQEHVRCRRYPNCQRCAFSIIVLQPDIVCNNSASAVHIRHHALQARNSNPSHFVADFAPEVILTATNVVDDAHHVCRAQTSLDLAQQLVKDRGFIHASLADITLGKVHLGQENGPSKVTIFSPFGLGILDLAVGSYVLEIARRKQKGLMVKSFFPVRGQVTSQ